MPSPKKPAPVAVEPVFTPIVITSRPEGEEIPMVTLFTLDGKDYKVPAKPDAGLALQVIRDATTYNETIANMMMLERVIGEEGMQALIDSGALKGEHVKQLGDAVTKLVLGALEDEDGGNS